MLVMELLTQSPLLILDFAGGHWAGVWGAEWAHRACQDTLPAGMPLPCPLGPGPLVAGRGRRIALGVFCIWVIGLPHPEEGQVCPGSHKEINADNLNQYFPTVVYVSPHSCFLDNLANAPTLCPSPALPPSDGPLGHISPRLQAGAALPQCLQSRHGAATGPPGGHLPGPGLGWRL